MKQLSEDHHVRGILFGLTGLMTFTAYLSINRYVYLHYQVNSFKYTATFLLASGVIATSGLMRRKTRERLSNFNRLTLLTVLNGLVGGAAMGLLIIGQGYTSAVNASIIASATTIPTMVFSHYMLRERFSRQQMQWFGVLLVGLYLAIVGGHWLHLQKGDLIILCSLIFFGFGNVFTKILLKHTPGGTLTDIRLMTTGLAFLTLGVLIYGSSLLVTSAGLWPILGGLCFWLTIKSFYASIRYIGPNLATLLTNSHPALTPFIGVIILSEPYSLIKGLGSMVLLLSVYKMTRRT